MTRIITNTDYNELGVLRSTGPPGNDRHRFDPGMHKALVQYAFPDHSGSPSYEPSVLTYSGR